MTDSLSETPRTDEGSIAPPVDLADFLRPDLVEVDLSVASRKRLFEHFAEMIFNTVALSEPGERGDDLDLDQIFDTLHDREKLGCTALGRGIAIPHGRVAQLSEPVVAIARLAEPIDYDAPDRVPVWLAICLLVPEDANEVHLNLLASLAAKLNDESIVREVKELKTAEELYDLFVGV